MPVADLGGFPAGQVWIDTVRKSSDSVGILRALRVFPILQNRGIGTRLIETAERVLCAREYAWAEIGVEKSSPRSLRLYQRLQYRPVASV